MWRELLSLCVLVCVVVFPGLCQRDNELTVLNSTTLGASGVVCTKQGRKCISDAACVDKKCQCLDGEHGLAEIECVPETDSLCSLYGDPHLTSFSQDTGTVALPCRFRAARFTTPNSDAAPGTGLCSIEVFATNEQIRGRYVTKGVHVALAVGDAGKGQHSTFHVYKTTDYDTSDANIYSYLTQTVSRDNPWGSASNSVDWLRILPTFDDVNNFAVLDVPQCGTRIKFRAFNMNTPKHQKQMPGLTISTPPDATFTDDFGDYPNAICGRPSDSSSVYKDYAESLGLIDADTGLIYAILSADTQDQQDNAFADQCSKTFELFGSSSDNITDVNECSFLLRKREVANCIAVSGRLPINLFNCCLAYQQGDTSGCSCSSAPASRCDGHADWSDSSGITEMEIGCGPTIE